MRRSFIDRLLLPALVGLATVFLALILLQRLLTQQHTEIEAETRTQAVFVKDKLESVLRVRTQSLELLGQRWQVRSLLNEVDMESDAALVMSGYPTYQALEWVDPSLQVSWVVPRSARQAEMSLELRADSAAKLALETAAASGHVTVSRPVNLPQGGGRGLLVCVPVRAEDKISGFLVGVFRYQDLLDSILQDVADDYWVAVYDGDEQIYSRAGATPPQKEAPAEEESVAFWQENWRARVWPKAEHLAYAQSILPQVTFVGGILMAAWLAFTVFMLETAKLHNKELRAEITGREQAEEELRQAQKMEAVGRLAGGVAHDFNNLLMVIRGHAALSLNYFDTGDPLHRELSEILRTTDRAASLTRQLLAFSRKQVLQPRVLDLNVLVEQVAELLPPVLGDDIQLIMDLQPDVGSVRADAAQIEQVIMNLVFNARDAMPRGGKLTIRTANSYPDDAWLARHPGVRPGPYVMLAVCDTGQGMDEETQSHIFEPFFTTKDRNKGTGLGLSTVYGTVEQSGGCVTVSSRLGKGTTIEIDLPRVEDPVEVVVEDDGEKLPLAPAEALSLDGDERILVVEDDDAVRRMTREFLKIRGYKVVEARSAADAIQYIQEDGASIDMVLTDVVMPGMKGRELGEHLAKIRPGIKVLYMSAYTEDAIMNYELLDPESTFIEKPFSPDELARKVKEVLMRNQSIGKPT